MIIDAHQHFWNPARGDYGWMTPDMPICRPYGPGDLKPLMDAAGVAATILVQAAPTTAETDYLLEIARQTPWVLGVVGWIDLEAPDAVQQVRRRAFDPLFVSVRPMLQDLADPNWILSPGLDPALQAIADSQMVFDALIFTPQIGAIVELARRYPTLSIVLDHAAKPRLGDAGRVEAWLAAMRPLAAMPNLVCKISGLATELAPGGTTRDLELAVETLLGLFGPERLLWGSDWPVLTLAKTTGDYTAWCQLVRKILAAKAPDVLNAVMGDTAAGVYHLRQAV